MMDHLSFELMADHEHLSAQAAVKYELRNAREVIFSVRASLEVTHEWSQVTECPLAQVA